MQKNLNEMTYPQFAALVGNNTPPGAESTVEWWIEKSLINKESSVLDLACCHGYSTFKIHDITGASVHGVDIEPYCIEQANYQNHSKKISFSVSNAENLELESQRFTHIVSGCSLGFVQDLDSAIKEAHRVLKENGSLCSSNFYYKNQPPETLLRQVKDILGFVPNSSFEEDFELFSSNKFKLKKSEKLSLLIFPQKVLKQVVKGFIEKQLKDSEQGEKIEAFERMYHTRNVLNELRRHQYYRNEIWGKI